MKSTLSTVAALIAGAWGLLPQSAPADASLDASPPLEEVTVIATKMDLVQAEMTQSSTVITHAELADQAQTDVTEALRQTPGIQFQVAGGPGQGLYTRLRGFTESTLYVFDGITMNEGGSGDIGYLLGQLDPTMVQRIEVLRGPHATLYGANTTSGVLAFTTLSADHPETDISFEGGSLEWKKARIGTQNEIPVGDGMWDYSLNGSWIDSGGVNEYEYYRNSTVVGRTAYRADALEVGGSFYGTINKFNVADLIESIPGATQANYFARQIPDPGNIDETKAGIASLWVEQRISNTLSQKLTIGVATQDFSLINNDTGNGGLIGSYVAPYNGWTDPSSYSVFDAGQRIPVYQTNPTYQTVSTNKEADYNFRYRSDFVSAVIGGSYIGQTYGEQDGFYGSASERQSTRSAYVDAALNMLGNSLHTELGARLDSYSQWRNKATYTVGLSYDIVNEFTLYANYGTSFTQPTLDQLYNPTDGSKNLTPANASTIEGGFRARQLEGALTESLTYWHSYVNNVINFDFNIYNPRIPGDYGEYANAEAERSQGGEFQASYRITANLTLTGNYTYTDSYLANSSGAWTFMVENARNMSNLGLNYKGERFVVGANMYATDHRLRWAGDISAPGYTRLDVYGRYHVTSRLDLYTRVKNALDHHIVETLGFKNPGIYAIAGAGYRF